MKKAFIVLFFVVSATLYAQFPSSFAGITFGQSLEETVTSLEESGYQVRLDENTAAYYTNIAGRGYLVLLSIINGKVNGVVAIHSPSYGEYFATYLRVLSELKEVYGEGTGNIIFLSPYEIGDGFEDQAIRSGFTRIAQEWKFENQYIRMMCTDKGETVLFYTYDVKTEEEKTEKEREITLSDY